MSLGGGIALGAILSYSHSRFSLHQFFLNSAVSFTYAFLIGTLISFTFQRILPRIGRFSPWLQWPIILVLSVGCAVAGTFVAAPLFVAVGWRTWDQFWDFFDNGVRLALITSTLVSISVFAYFKLRQQLGTTERLAAQARLSSLESRIRPHFLFNALNAVLALIPEDPATAEKVLQRLTRLLRFSLEVDPSGVVPLGEELRIVRDYLEIERTRFGDRLRFELDVPGELSLLELPTFAVQTLVENAVKYAVTPRREGALVRVRAERANGRLRVEVSDDGPGFDALSFVPGHGLDLLRSRLSALYGASGTLTILPPARVVLELPAAGTA